MLRWNVDEALRWSCLKHHHFSIGNFLCWLSGVKKNKPTKLWMYQCNALYIKQGFWSKDSELEPFNWRHGQGQAFKPPKSSVQMNKCFTPSKPRKKEDRIFWHWSAASSYLSSDKGNVQRGQHTWHLLCTAADWLLLCVLQAWEFADPWTKPSHTDPDTKVAEVGSCLGKLQFYSQREKVLSPCLQPIV